eukprot:scaffold88735_cov28-Tisochrysis_lutea.AAC.11
MGHLAVRGLSSFLPRLAALAFKNYIRDRQHLRGTCSGKSGMGVRCCNLNSHRDFHGSGREGRTTNPTKFVAWSPVTRPAPLLVLPPRSARQGRGQVAPPGPAFQAIAADSRCNHGGS